MFLSLLLARSVGGVLFCHATCYDVRPNSVSRFHIPFVMIGRQVRIHEIFKPGFEFFNARIRRWFGIFPNWSTDVSNDRLQQTE